MSQIEWTNETWNPILGCDPVSAGCVNCFAPSSCITVHRTSKGYLPHGQVIRRRADGAWVWKGGTVILNAPNILYSMRATRPLRPRKRPLRVFVNSLSDVFHARAIEQRFTDLIYREMRACRWNVYQVLTKRPELAARWYAENPQAHDHPHIWLGISVEDARVKDRIDILRAIPAAIRFLSCEPLIGPLGRLDLTGIHWVIVGGESARQPRPMQADWVREIRDQCVAVNTPFFFKQWGGRQNAKGGHEHAILDGREWKDFPD